MSDLQLLGTSVHGGSDSSSVYRRHHQGSSLRQPPGFPAPPSPLRGRHNAAPSLPPVHSCSLAGPGPVWPVSSVSYPGLLQGPCLLSAQDHGVFLPSWPSFTLQMFRFHHERRGCIPQPCLLRVPIRSWPFCFISQCWFYPHPGAPSMHPGHCPLPSHPTEIQHSLLKLWSTLHSAKSWNYVYVFCPARIQLFQHHLLKTSISLLNCWHLHEKSIDHINESLFLDFLCTSLIFLSWCQHHTLLITIGFS